MIQFIVSEDRFEIGPCWDPAPIFPEDSILINRTPFTLNYMDWDCFFSVCQKIQQQVSHVKYVFVDATWDPMRPNNQELLQRLEEMKRIFIGANVVVLSMHAQHYYDELPGVIYVPSFATCVYPTPEFRPRAGRFGCLNRRPALHRIRLMYNALQQKLIDSDRDVFSIRFVGLYTNSAYDFRGTGYEWMATELQHWPAEMASHPDGWPCDYSISHPAWHTGISIITETEPGDRTIICEKTAKGILSKSCFTVYMADVGYRVLEDLGFAPRFFADHAEYDNIEPLLRLMKDFDSEAAAMDYRQQHLDQINHNYQWFGIDTPDFCQRSWYSRYEPKLKAALANL